MLDAVKELAQPNAWKSLTNTGPPAWRS